MPGLLNPVRRGWHASRRLMAKVWLNAVHRNTFQVAITGSYGKTSTTRAIYAVVARHTPTVVTDLNLDTIYNVPITALKLRGQPLIIFELGIDTPNEMAFHLELVRPRIGVLTGLAPVHTDEKHLGSFEAIITQKRKVIEALPPDGLAVLNYDDPLVRQQAQYARARVVGYGTAPDCDYRAENISLRLDGSRFRAVTPEGAFEVETPLPGAHNCANLMAVIAVTRALDVPMDTILQTFKELEALKGRANVEEGPLGTMLINDALRANPASTKAGLRYLRDLDVAGQRIAVLGEMGELGISAVPEHEDVGRVAASADLDWLLCIGPLTRHIAQAARAAGMDGDRIVAVDNVREVADRLREIIVKGDVLYLKGSLMRHLERVILLLENQQTVGCVVVSCPFYHQCTACQYLETGYNPA